MKYFWGFLGIFFQVSLCFGQDSTAKDKFDFNIEFGNIPDLKISVFESPTTPDIVKNMEVLATVLGGGLGVFFENHQGFTITKIEYFNFTENRWKELGENNRNPNTGDEISYSIDFESTLTNLSRIRVYGIDAKGEEKLFLESPEFNYTNGNFSFEFIEKLAQPAQYGKLENLNAGYLISLGASVPFYKIDQAGRFKFDAGILLVLGGSFEYQQTEYRAKNGLGGISTGVSFGRRSGFSIGGEWLKRKFAFDQNAFPSFSGYESISIDLINLKTGIYLKLFDRLSASIGVANPVYAIGETNDGNEVKFDDVAFGKNMQFRVGLKFGI